MNKIHWNKFNHGGERPFTLKITRTLMEKQKTPKRGKIFHAQGVENLILLKCLYYPKQFKIQYNPYQNYNGIFHKIEKKQKIFKKQKNSQKL